MANFEDIVRRSIRKDFANAHFRKMGTQVKTPHPINTRRIGDVLEHLDYYKFRRFLVGKLIRIIQESASGGKWVEFVNDSDRQALNNAAGWSDNKRQYLLNAVKFDD